MGWVVSRHGALYAEEFGWDVTFEAFVAEIAAKLIREFDPERERSWIAELDYRKLTLWPSNILDAARRLYEDAGFTLVRRERHSSFGKSLVGEYWELDLERPVTSSRRDP